MALDESKRIFKQDESGDMVRLGEELDHVSGGVFGLGSDHSDGHEKCCAMVFHWEDECDESPDRFHFFETFTDTDDYGYEYEYEECKYCGTWFEAY